jgi:hypothetical protein
MLSSDFSKLKGVELYPMLRNLAKRAGFRSLTAMCKAAGIKPQNVQRWKNTPPPAWRLLQTLLATAVGNMDSAPEAKGGVKMCGNCQALCTTPICSECDSPVTYQTTDQW